VDQKLRHNQSGTCFLPLIVKPTLFKKSNKHARHLWIFYPARPAYYPPKAKKKAYDGRVPA